MKSVNACVHGVKSVEVKRNGCNNGVRILVNGGGLDGLELDLFSDDYTADRILLSVEYLYLSGSSPLPTDEQIVEFLKRTGQMVVQVPEGWQQCQN